MCTVSVETLMETAKLPNVSRPRLPSLAMSRLAKIVEAILLGKTENQRIMKTAKDGAIPRPCTESDVSAKPTHPVIHTWHQGYAPRFLRARDAPAYLAMCRDEFNRTVRPHVREFPIGQRGVGFDRKELDAWADAYVERSAIKKPSLQEGICSDTRKVDSAEASEEAFRKALDLVQGKKQGR